MTKSIVGIAVAFFVTMILFVAFKQTQTAQSTTTWGATELTMWGLLGVIFLLIVIILAFKTISGKTGT